MKTRMLVLGSVGVAAGLLYALESNRRKQYSFESASDDDVESQDLSLNNEDTTASDIDEGFSDERGASMGRVINGEADLAEGEPEPVIDDQGTDQFEASQILKNIRDNAFEASDEKLAVALGRPTEEIEEWVSGEGVIDGDVVMKARALAMQRGLEVE
ncbi:MAG TPA: hypothetical protein VGN86_16825 [Pyrinomonadaceae bacterium]|nr:hypothetical protein [Pyrinomonadaceae bacterium]